VLKDKIKHYRTDAEYFDYFKTENPAIEDEERRRMQFLKRKIKFEPGSIIIDCGSGGGWIAREYIPRGITVVSVDIADSNLRKIKQAYDPEGKGFYVVADLYDLPFKHDVFDGGASNDVYEHIEKPERAAGEVKRCIKKGGKFFVSVPYKENIIYYICVHCNKPTPINAHLHSFDKESLRQVFEGSGLRIVKMQPFINKALQLTLISYFLMRWMPYWLWRFFDSLVSLVIRKHSRVALTMVSD
jgi:SAM-dependent methyltransferase